MQERKAFTQLSAITAGKTLRITDTLNGFFFFFCITVLCFQASFSVKDLYYEMVLLAPSLVFQRLENECFYLFLPGTMELPW